MNQFGTIALGLLGGLAIIAGIGWAGFQVRPNNLSPPADAPEDLGSVEIPTDVPDPVRQFFRAAYGEEAPRVDSLAVYGRARANFGLWLPLRFRLVHLPGQAFERYMEITWFGRTILKAVDHYAEGRGKTGPIGREATGPEIDQGANMILWAEAPLMPSLWITDECIRWEAIDKHSARLFFPLGKEEDELVVHFDPETHLITRLTALRYRDAESGKIPWHADFLDWKTVKNAQAPARIAITWEDQGKPWSYWDLEDYYWNVDIGPFLTQPVSAKTEGGDKGDQPDE